MEWYKVTSRAAWRNEAFSTVVPEKEDILMQSFAETWLEEGREEGRRQALEAIALSVSEFLCTQTI